MKTTIRLSTQYYKSGSNFIIKKVITPLKRKSSGYNLIVDESYNVGVEEVLSNIVNIDDYEDGIYEVVITNISRDYWLGGISDYQYKLVKYQENKLSII